MGGHGGLNILPQKRWNVYGRENRLKVKRDEAQANAEQAQKDAIHQKAESEFRHAILLKRANERVGATQTSEDGQQLDNTASMPNTRDETGEDEAFADRRTAIIPTKPASKEAFDLLGFLNNEASQHPEVEAEKRKEAAKRGEAKTQTSDARFDSQFAFGHGLTGDKAQPWYVSGSAQMAPGDTKFGKDQEKEDLPAASESNTMSHKSGSKQKQHKSEKKERRKEKKHKKDKKKKRKHGGIEKNSKGPKASKQFLEVLRTEREAREKAERDKAKKVLREAYFGVTGEPEGKRYHSAYRSQA